MIKRALVAIVLVAVSIRIVLWLLAPVWPYLLAALLVFTFLRIAAWYRGRW